MDRNRQGQIARAMLKKFIEAKGVRLGSDFGRQVGNEVKALNEIDPDLKLTAEELSSLYIALVDELFTAFKDRQKKQ